MFRDPAYFRALREQVVPVPAHLSVAQGLGRRLQHRRGGLLARDPARARRGCSTATIDLRDRHQSRERCAPPRRASTTVDRVAALHARTTSAPAASGSLSDYYTARVRSARASTARCASTIVFSDHSLATDSVFAEVQLVSCRNVLIYFDRALQDRALGLFRDSLCRRGFLGLGSRETLRFTDLEKDFAEVADRWYQRCLTPRLPDVKVLLVDDLEENLFALTQILRRDGLELITARSGGAALELLLDHDFALAIIDVQMPEMDGFELAEIDARPRAHPARADHLRHRRGRTSG